MKLILETEEEVRQFSNLLDTKPGAVNPLAAKLDAISNTVESLSAVMEKITGQLPGGKIVADIKDSDDVAIDGNYDETLYQHAIALAECFRDNNDESLHDSLTDTINEVTGDYEIRTGLSDNAYQTLIDDIRSLCVISDTWEFQQVDKDFKS